MRERTNTIILHIKHRRRDKSPNLSMRQKSALKRRITREHNSNFRAGYININEQYLHKTGIRGRKRYFLYCMVLLLGLVVIVNGLLTAGIIYFLRISPQYGMEVVEYIPDNDLLRILGKAVFDTVKTYGRVGSRANTDLNIEGQNSSVIIKDSGQNKKASTMTVGSEKISFENIDNMVIKDISSDKEIFTLKQDSEMSLDGEIENLKASEIYVYNISNLVTFPNLNLYSIGNRVNLTGSEGVRLTSSEGKVTFHSIDHSLRLVTTDDSLIFDAAEYFNLNTDTLTKVSTPGQVGKVAYKICVCVPQGKLFSVAVTSPGIGCHNAGGDGDPCK